MAKRSVAHPKGSKPIPEEDHPTSPSIDVESNTQDTLATDLTTKPRPKPRPKPAKQANTPFPLDAVDEIPHQHPKRGRPRSDTNETVPASNVQPPAKKTKISNTTSPVQRSGKVGNSRAKVVPPRSPLPSRTNRVVNPGAPDKKRKKRTSAEVAAAAEQKKILQLELERIEKDKIRMLAEMEAVEEEEEREEERMRIKDIADLAESHGVDGDSETDTQYVNEGMASDDDIVMADNREDCEEVNDAFVEVDSEPEPEGPRPDTVKTVSELMHPEDDESFPDLGVPFNRGKLLGLGGIFEQQLTRRRESLVRNQGSFFFLLFYLLTTYGSTISLSAKLGDNSPYSPLKRTSKTTTRKSTNLKNVPTVPTGLVADWRSKISKKTSYVSKHQQRAQASSPLGGLVDDDAHGKRPQADRQHNKTRKNEVLQFLFPLQ